MKDTNLYSKENTGISSEEEPLQMSNIKALLNLKSLFFSRQVRNFIIAGIISSLADLMVLTILVEVVRLPVLISTVCSILVATLINYFLSIKYVFDSGKLKRHYEVIAFYSLAGFGFIFNLSLMWFFYEILLMWYILARILSMGINVVINFLVKKYMIFKK